MPKSLLFAFVGGAIGVTVIPFAVWMLFRVSGGVVDGICAGIGAGLGAGIGVRLDQAQKRNTD